MKYFILSTAMIAPCLTAFSAFATPTTPITNHFSYEYVSEAAPATMCANQESDAVSGRLLWDPETREYRSDANAVNVLHLSEVSRLQIEISSDITKDEATTMDFADTWTQNLDYSVTVTQSGKSETDVLNNNTTNQTFSHALVEEADQASRISVTKKDATKLVGIFRRQFVKCSTARLPF